MNVLQKLPDYVQFTMAAIIMQMIYNIEYKLQIAIISEKSYKKL